MTPYEVFAGALTVLGGVSVAYAAYAKHRFDRRFAAKPIEASDLVEPSSRDQAAMTVLIDQALAVTKTAATLQKAIMDGRTAPRVRREPS